MRFVSFVIVLFALGMNQAWAKTTESPETMVRKSLSAIGYEAGLFDEAHRSFKANFITEIYKADEGFRVTEISEALVFEDNMLKFRSEFSSTRPEKSPEVFLEMHFLIGKEMWRVRNSEDGEGLQAEKVHFQDDSTRVLPQIIQYLSFFLAHPEKYPAVFSDQGTTTTENDLLRVIDIFVDFGSAECKYRFFFNSETNLPARVENVTSSFSSEFKGWEDFGACKVPREVISTWQYSGKDSLESLESRSSTILKSIDFNPEFPENYFELPDSISVRR